MLCSHADVTARRDMLRAQMDPKMHPAPLWCGLAVACKIAVVVCCVDLGIRVKAFSISSSVGSTSAASAKPATARPTTASLTTWAAASIASTAAVVELAED